jgi:hypothetical protein
MPKGYSRGRDDGHALVVKQIAVSALSVAKPALWIPGNQSCTFARARGEKLALYGSGAYFLLLLLATGFAALNAVERTQGRRMFWAFIAGGYALWTLAQWLYIYYVTIRHIDVPDNSIADPESAKKAAGLGLISMQERVRLVGGQLSVESEPSRGTRIHVRILRQAIDHHVGKRGFA